MTARGGLAQGLLLAALTLPVFPAAAADDSAAARSALDQRLRLTASLVADGNTAQRIMASGNQRAIAHLDEGRVHHALAQDLLAKGDLAGARREADEALKNLSQARRLVPDTPGQMALTRTRYEQMLASLERLVESWRQRLVAAKAAASPDGGDTDLVAATGLMQTARGLGAEGRFDEAVRTLGTAETHVLAGMNRLMHASTLDYTARASTPAEEYQLELARHRSLADLVPLAVSDLKPRPEALILIERYTEASTALRNQAEQRFNAGDPQQALAHLRNALLYVQRALTAAGLVVPQAAGGTQ
jgi:tetratricopeptide (TPR) repeat protein